MKTISKTHSHSNKFDRRTLLAGGLASVLVAGMPRVSMAASQQDAEQLILKVVGEVQTIINSGRSEASMIQSFQGMFQKYAHVTTIARSLLGPAWKSASAADQKAYMSALQGYLARKYGKQFRSFIGASIEVTNSQDFGRKGIIVESLVKSPKFSTTKVEWHVVESGGQLKFFDLYVAGVKLISTERAEVRTVLDRSGGSVGRLAQALNGMG